MPGEANPKRFSTICFCGLKRNSRLHQVPLVKRLDTQKPAVVLQVLPCQPGFSPNFSIMKTRSEPDEVFRDIRQLADPGAPPALGSGGDSAAGCKQRRGAVGQHLAQRSSGAILVERGDERCSCRVLRSGCDGVDPAPISAWF